MVYLKQRTVAERSLVLPLGLAIVPTLNLFTVYS